MTLFRNGAYLPGTTQNFTTTASSQNSNAVGSSTGIIRIAVNQDTYVALGNATPTANNTCMMIPAGHVELVCVTESASEVAFVQVTTGGRISITELK
jgi:hypothetical protein